MHDDNFDDGLVHNHNWAKEPPRAGVLLPSERDDRPAEADEAKQAAG